jgi:hypothetical protein
LSTIPSTILTWLTNIPRNKRITAGLKGKKKGGEGRGFHVRA